jgi:hypothetical protein
VEPSCFLEGSFAALLALCLVASAWAFGEDVGANELQSGDGESWRGDTEAWATFYKWGFFDAMNVLVDRKDPD